MGESVPEQAHQERPRWLRKVAYAALVVVGLLAAFVGFLHTPPARRYVVSGIIEVLRQQNVEFNADDVSYNLLDLSVRFRNLRIRAQDAPDLPLFAHIDEARLDLSLTQLLRGRYVLEQGQARGVRVYYYVGGTGRDNLPRPPHDPEQPSQPLDYFIDQFAVLDARVRYENRVQHIDLSLPVSSIQIDGSAITNRHNIRVRAAGGTIAFENRDARLDRVAGEFDLGDNDVTIANAEVEIAGSRLALTGSVVGFEAPQANLALRSTIDAARASSLAGLKDAVGGAVRLDATVKGPIATPAIAGRISGSSLSFRNLHGVEVSADASYDIGETRAAFSSLDVRAPWGRVTGDGVLAMADTGESRLTATLAGVDAETLMRALGVEYIAASRVDGHVEASWPSLQYEKAIGETTVTLTATRNVASRSAMPVAGRIHATGAGGRIGAQLIRVRAAGTELNGRVAITDEQQLSGSVNARVADAGRTLASIEGFLGRARGSLAPAPVSGAIQANVRLGGTARAPALDGTDQRRYVERWRSNRNRTASHARLRAIGGQGRPSGCHVAGSARLRNRTRGACANATSQSRAECNRSGGFRTAESIQSVIRTRQRHSVASGEHRRDNGTAHRVDHDPR